MIYCEYCSLEMPSDAQYCSNCGHMLGDRNATVTEISNPIEFGPTVRHTPPPLSNRPNINIQASGMGLQDAYATHQTYWSFEESEFAKTQDMQQTDENEFVIPDVLLPGMLAMQNPISSPSQPPMVQGTPQFGGVPSVQGTPAAGNVSGSIPGSAHGAASSAPSFAPQEAQAVPMQHQQMQYASYQKPASHYQPVHQAHPGSTTYAPKHKTHSHKLHHSGAKASTKAGMGALSKWLIIVVVSLVVIGSGSVLLAHALMPTTPPPSLSITGSSVVRGGDVMHIHGQGFHAGDGVALTIDNGLAAFSADQRSAQAASNGTVRNALMTNLLQMNVAGMVQTHSSLRSSVTVSSKGTFDANITVPSNLPAGLHTIHATDNQNSLSASLSFTVSSSKLEVNPSTLQFGSVEVGRSVKLLATLSNPSEVGLHWNATVEGSNTNWLTLSKNNDALGTNGANETVIVTANTKGLSVGSHTATVRFHAENGDVLMAVSINVVAPGQSGQQPILNASPQKLDFGQLQAGQPAKQNISIGNLGNLPLQWQASTDAASANWLSLSTSKGTVQPGAVPLSVQVNVNSSGLAAGSYSGTVNITSNGGNTQVKVTLNVTSSTRMPAVTGINPASGSATGGTLVTITGTGFSGATSVSFGTTAASNVNVKNDTQITVTSPAGSGTVDVTVTTPVGTSATSAADQFTYVTVPPAAPTVTAIKPSSGPDTGGTAVTITGTGFTGATNVTFGQTPASKFSVVSDTQIMATSPAGSGTVHVTLTTPNGTSATSAADQFTYTVIPPAAPTVTAIKPSSGSDTGGTSVTITGTGFSGTTSVSFGQTPASSFNIKSDTQITATSPAGSGTVDVTVTTPGGTSVISAADQFTYTTPTPMVTGLKPNSGYTTGGTTVTIVGTNFTGAKSVTFGQTAASNFSVVSDTQITTTSPAGSGTVDVMVTTASGTSATSSKDQFIYMTPPPAITSISPQSGYTTGGTTVVITGKGFTGATSVSFGQTSTISFKVDSDTQITVTSPAVQSTGTVDVTVTTPGGTSTTSTSDQFTYNAYIG